MIWRREKQVSSWRNYEYKETDKFRTVVSDVSSFECKPVGTKLNDTSIIEEVILAE